MGRPIKKKWFTAKAGSTSGNLTIRVADDTAETFTDEEIIRQVGTGVYVTASGRYKLVEGPAVHVSGDGLATLTHDGRYVSKINQFRVTYFDDDNNTTEEDAVWNDGKGAIIGTFVPALTTEGEIAPVVLSEPVTEKAIVEEKVVEEKVVEEKVVEEKVVESYSKKSKKKK